MSWSTSNMSDPNLDFFHHKNQILFINSSYQCIINVAVNCLQWFEGVELISSFNITNVSCMPYFVTFCKMIKKPRVNPSMRIREKTNFHILLQNILIHNLVNLCAFVSLWHFFPPLRR